MRFNYNNYYCSLIDYCMQVITILIFFFAFTKMLLIRYIALIAKPNRILKLIKQILKNQLTTYRIYIS